MAEEKKAQVPPPSYFQQTVVVTQTFNGTSMSFFDMNTLLKSASDTSATFATRAAATRALWRATVGRSVTETITFPLRRRWWRPCARKEKTVTRKIEYPPVNIDTEEDLDKVLNEVTNSTRNFNTVNEWYKRVAEKEAFQFGKHTVYGNTMADSAWTSPCACRDPSDATRVVHGMRAVRAWVNGAPFECPEGCCK
jgi:hypothetical protein